MAPLDPIAIENAAALNGVRHFGDGSNVVRSESQLQAVELSTHLFDQRSNRGCTVLRFLTIAPAEGAL